MDRRNFLKSLGLASAYAAVPGILSAGSLDFLADEGTKAELSHHKLQQITFKQVQLRYPRLVGKNSRLGVHGRGPGMLLCILTTDKGAKGFGPMMGNRAQAEARFEVLKGKRVSELFSPSEGTLDEQDYVFDFCLHDLAGVILNKPVYEMMGAAKPIVTQCYSGMIYFDEMEPEDNPSGLGKVLENCRFDYDYGYRQLKVKIGRGGKWMSKEEGLRTDIEVTKMVYENFPDCDIMVDGNDAFTYDYFISYLEGVEDIPLFWIEEPFRETREDCTKLKQWLMKNGRRNTLLCDGEAWPDLPLALELGEAGVLDVYIDDIQGYGFTRWRKLMPRLRSIGMMASPHAWGDTLKSFYAAQLVAAYGNCPSIEGVTCFSDDVDFSGYKLRRGRLTPPALPGFGMKLEV